MSIQRQEELKQQEVEMFNTVQTESITIINDQHILLMRTFSPNVVL